MAEPRNAVLIVHRYSGVPDPFEVQYNPTELSFDKSSQLTEANIPGLDAPLQQFVRGQAERLTIELFFDTTEGGTGSGAESVTGQTDRVYELVKIEPERHAPPPVTFMWNSEFCGSGLPGAAGNQRRNSFKGIAESVKQKFTLYSPEGIPLRARVTLVLREFRPLEEQLAQLNLNSPDRTHGHVLAQGETLSGIAHRYYRRSRAWRYVATKNNIDDVRRLDPGMVLVVPPVTERGS